MSEPMEVTTRAYEVIERPVKSMGNSGGVYLPVSWTGKRVKIFLLDPVEDEKIKQKSD